MAIQIKAETDHYVLIAFPFNGFYNVETEPNYPLECMEQMLKAGYRPLHYENRQYGYVCEKPGVRAEIGKS